MVFYSGGYCELSDIEMRDLKPNQDFNLDQRFLLFTWDFDEVHCFGSPSPKVPPPTSSCEYTKFSAVYFQFIWEVSVY